MIDAVNQGVTELAAIPNDLMKLPPQIQELVAACQASGPAEPGPGCPKPA